MAIESKEELKQIKQNFINSKLNKFEETSQDKLDQFKIDLENNKLSVIEGQKIVLSELKMPDIHTLCKMEIKIPDPSNVIADMINAKSHNLAYQILKAIQSEPALIKEMYDSYGNDLIKHLLFISTSIFNDADLCENLIKIADLGYNPVYKSEFGNEINLMEVALYANNKLVVELLL